MTSEPASRAGKDGEIWVICGNACAGKSTTARLLAQRLPLAAHVDGDEMQRLIVGAGDHPEAATFAARVQAAADGRPVNEFEGIIEQGLDRLPRVGLWVDPSGRDPESVVDLLLDRQADAAWMVRR